MRPLAAPVHSAPAALPQVVVVSASGLYGLSAADGSILWQRPEIVAGDAVSPMVVDKTIIIGAAGPDGAGAAVYAVDAITGQDAWPAPALLPAGFETRVTAAAAPDLGLLFAGLGPAGAAAQPESGPGAVMAFRLADGSPAWPAPVLLSGSAPASGVSVGWVSAVGWLTVLEPALFVTAGGSVTALDANTGAALWTRSLPERHLPGPAVLSTAAPQRSRLYVGGESRRVYVLDSTTGADAPGGLTAPAAPITGTLALAGSYLYVPTARGLVAADAATGALLWSIPLAATSGVAVAGGAPCVATGDGSLVSFGQTPLQTQAPSPGQFPGQSPFPGQFPPAVAPQAPAPGQFPGQSPSPGQFPVQSPFPGQFPPTPGAAGGGP